MKNNVKTATYTRNGEEINFNYYTSLSANNKMKFVKTVTNILVGEDYFSIVRDLIFDFAIVEIFTDVDTSEITNPNNYDSIGKIEELLDETNIVEIVRSNVEDDLIEELAEAIDDDIAYHTGIHKNPLAESASALLDVLKEKVVEFDVEKISKYIFNELTVEKVLEAYAKSDTFKKNRRKSTTKTIDKK